MPSIYGTQASVGKTKVLLIEDYVLGTPPNVDTPLRLYEGDDKTNPIWFSEAQLSAMRNSGSKAKAYGVWQILLHNNVIDTGVDGLWVYDLDGPRWAYLYVEDGKAVRSGVSVGAGIPALPMVSKEDAQVLDVSERALAALALPPVSAQLPSEIASSAAKSARLRTIITSVATGATLAGAFLVNYSLEMSYQDKVDAFQRAKREVTSLQRTIADLEMKISPVRDDDRKRQQMFLQRLTTLTAYASKIRSEKPIAVYDTNEVAGIDAEGLIAGIPFPWSLDLNRSGKVTLSFSIKPDGTEITPAPNTKLIENQLGENYALRK